MTKMQFNKRKQPLIIKNLVEHFVEKKKHDSRLQSVGEMNNIKDPFAMLCPQVTCIGSPIHTGMTKTALPLL